MRFMGFNGGAVPSDTIILERLIVYPRLKRKTITPRTSLQYELEGVFAGFQEG